MTTATPTAPRRSTPSEQRPAADRPQQAAGLELLGRFEDSGFKDPPYLARRRDGQIIQLSRLLYLVAHAADGERDAEAIAACVGPRIGRGLSADNVTFLVERKLRPLGVLAAADGSTPELRKRPALLALRHRRPLLPARVVRALAAPFTPLFAPPIIAIVLVTLAVFDAWLFGIHGVAQGLRTVLYEPTLLLGLVVCVITATVFHEIGHAAACRYGGARPGAIGVGLYIVWPAFYCDVTDAYRLNRRGRLRTDLGGIYFNGIVSLLAGGAYFATHQEPLLLLAVVQHITMVQQLIPLLRFDGYYVLTDLTGVPDVLSRIGPILRSLVPFRPAEPKVRELRPRVRVAVTLYIALLVPVLAMLLSWMVVGAPRVLATAVDSVGLHVTRLSETLRRGEWSVSALACLQITALVLQCAGMALVLGRTGKSAVRGLKRWSRGSVPRKAVAAAACGGALCALAAIWWPNGEYRPLLPGERGTIPEAIAALPAVSDARPAFSSGNGTLLGFAPAVREVAGPALPHQSGTRMPAGVAPAEPLRRDDRPAPVPGDGTTRTPDPDPGLVTRRHRDDGHTGDDSGHVTRSGLVAGSRRVAPAAADSDAHAQGQRGRRDQHAGRLAGLPARLRPAVHPRRHARPVEYRDRRRELRGLPDDRRRHPGPDRDRRSRRDRAHERRHRAQRGVPELRDARLRLSARADDARPPVPDGGGPDQDRRDPRGDRGPRQLRPPG